MEEYYACTPHHQQKPTSNRARSFPKLLRRKTTSADTASPELPEAPPPSVPGGRDGYRRSRTPPNHHVVPEQAQAVGEPRRGVIPGSLLPQRRREKGRGWGGPSMEGWWRRKPTRMCSSAICSRGVGGEGGVGERRSGWRTSAERAQRWQLLDGRGKYLDHNLGTYSERVFF
jgi:hypothetical protein